MACQSGQPLVTVGLLHTLYTGLHQSQIGNEDYFVDHQNGLLAEPLVDNDHNHTDENIDEDSTDTY